MNHQHKLRLLLLSLIGLVIALNIYFLMEHTKLEVPQPPKSMRLEESVYEELPEADYLPMPTKKGSRRVGIHEAENAANLLIREIPVPLDDTMAEHLNQFRKQAAALHRAHPDAFVLSLPTDEKVVALTFDDGPDRHGTLKILRQLNQFDVPATFFFIGNNLAQYPAVVEAVHEGGHLIANHSWSHGRPLQMDAQELLLEVENTQRRLLHWFEPIPLYRPPYGLVTEEQLLRLQASGYITAAWSVDSMDWYFDDPETIAVCVLEAIHPGAIILMHSAGGKNHRRGTLEALPIIIRTLKDQGYSFVTLEMLIQG